MNKKRLLILDNDSSFLEAMSLLLNSEGYYADLAQKSDYVNELTKKTLPHLIVLDLHLDEKGTGKKIASDLKKSNLTQKVPLILCSADPDVEKISKEVGAEDFIKKPFEVNEFLVKVKAFLLIALFVGVNLSLIDIVLS